MAQIPNVIPPAVAANQGSKDALTTHVGGKISDSETSPVPFKAFSQTSAEKGSADDTTRQGGDKIKYFSSLLSKFLKGEKLEQGELAALTGESEEEASSSDFFEKEPGELSGTFEQSDFGNPLLAAVEHFFSLLEQYGKNDGQLKKALEIFEHLSECSQQGAPSHQKSSVIFSAEDRVRAADVLIDGIDKNTVPKGNKGSTSASPGSFQESRHLEGSAQRYDAYLEEILGEVEPDSVSNDPLNGVSETGNQTNAKASTASPSFKSPVTDDVVEEPTSADPKAGDAKISGDQKEDSSVRPTENLETAAGENKKIDGVNGEAGKSVEQVARTSKPVEKVSQRTEKAFETPSEFEKRSYEQASGPDQQAGLRPKTEPLDGAEDGNTRSKNSAQAMFQAHRQDQGFSFAQNGVNGAHQLSSQDLLSINEDETFNVQQDNTIDDSVVEQVSKGIVNSIVLKRRRAILQLNPPELGKVRVELVVHRNSNIHATFLADQPEAKHILETNMVQLKEQLEAQGFQLGSCSVDIGQGWGNQQDNSSFDGWNFGNGLADGPAVETEPMEFSEVSIRQGMAGRVHIVV